MVAVRARRHEGAEGPSPSRRWCRAPPPLPFPVAASCCLAAPLAPSLPRGLWMGTRAPALVPPASVAPGLATAPSQTPHRRGHGLLPSRRPRRPRQRQPRPRAPCPLWLQGAHLRVQAAPPERRRVPGHAQSRPALHPLSFTGPSFVVIAVTKAGRWALPLRLKDSSIVALF
jgi:hypothetical protein